jgi:dTDP-4-dehydrorhamnose 3,5-epimerase
MNIKKTDSGLFVIEPHVFEDYRGEYIEIYNENEYQINGIDVHFVQDDISISAKHVLKGIHGDSNTWKLVSCLSGRIYLVVVNCDVDSKDFGKWDSFIISDKNYRQVLLPPKFGNSILTLSDISVFHYKQSTYYNKSGQFTYKWNDPRFGITWPIDNPILSERDR